MRRRSDSRLLAALLLSAALHGAVLSGVASWTDEPAPPSRGGTVKLALVTVEAPAATAAALATDPNASPGSARLADSVPKSPPASDDSAPSRPEPSSRAARRAAPVQPVESSTSEPQPVPLLQPVESEQNRAISDSDIRRQNGQVAAAARAAVKDHFFYPLLARRRGWEGEVVLSFGVDRAGRILGAEVARSSGHGVLDRAALDALARVGQLETPEQWAGTPRLLLPVRYRLAEG